MRRVVRVVIACSAGLVLWASTAAAQDRSAPTPPSPEQMQAQMTLVAKGFTREEALQIVRGAGIPSMPSR